MHKLCTYYACYQEKFRISEHFPRCPRWASMGARGRRGRFRDGARCIRMHGGCSLRMGGMSTLWTKHERFHGKGPEQQTHLPCARALVPKPKQSRVGGWRMKMLSMGLSMGTLKCEPAVLEPQWHRASSHIQICANDQQAGQPKQMKVTRPLAF